MPEEVTVTRGSQITLTKSIRDRMNVREGDIVILNMVGDMLMISKRDPKVFDNLKNFLPENFEKILDKMRYSEKERLKKLGIIE